MESFGVSLSKLTNPSLDSFGKPRYFTAAETSLEGVSSRNALTSDQTRGKEDGAEVSIERSVPSASETALAMVRNFLVSCRDLRTSSDALELFSKIFIESSEKSNAIPFSQFAGVFSVFNPFCPQIGSSDCKKWLLSKGYIKRRKSESHRKHDYSVQVCSSFPSSREEAAITLCAAQIAMRNESKLPSANVNKLEESVPSIVLPSIRDVDSPAAPADDAEASGCRKRSYLEEMGVPVSKLGRVWSGMCF